MMKYKNVALFSLLLISFAYSSVLPQFLGIFSLSNAAFLNIERWSPSDPYMLLATSFYFLPGYDVVSYVPNIASQLRNINGTVATTITSAITWPNEAEVVPAKVFPGRKVISVAGGFLVPFQWTGAINLIDFSSGTPQVPVQISVDQSEYFYHRVRWYDVDNDGLIDVVSSQATKPIFGDAQGFLVWLKNPGNMAFLQEWEEQKILFGPDFFFEFVDLDNNGVPEIIAAQFFTAQLTLYWTDTNWLTPSSVHSRVIDNTIGPLFDVKVVDLNNDGKVDFLVTNHIDDPTNSGIFAYEYPVNWKKDPWTKHVLYVGFITRESGSNQASPGEPVTFHPYANSTSLKPWILLGGDGSQEAYIINPNSESKLDWTYTVTVLVNVAGTVGQVAVADINNDGFSEAFVPDYDHGKIYAYSWGNTNNF